MARIPLLVLVCLLTGTFLHQACAAETYALRGHPKGVAQVMLRDTFTLSWNDVIVVHANGARLGSFESKATTVEETEFLSDKETRSLARINDIINQGSIAGKPIDETKTDPLEGVIIIGKRTGDTWRFHMDDGTPDTEQAEALEELTDQARLDYEIYPAKPLAVGDTLPLDKDALRSFGGPNAKVLDGSGGSMTLEEILTYEGQTCARVSFKLELHSQEMQEGKPVNMIMLFEGTVIRSLDHYLDLTFEATGEMETSFDTPHGRIYFRGPITLQGSSSLVDAA